MRMYGMKLLVIVATVSTSLAGISCAATDGRRTQSWSERTSASRAATHSADPSADGAEKLSSEVEQHGQRFRARHEEEDLDWLAKHFLRKGMSAGEVERVLGKVSKPTGDDGDNVLGYRVHTHVPESLYLHVHLRHGRVTEWEWEWDGGWLF